MIKKIIIFLMLIIISSSVFSEVTDISISRDYINSTQSIQFTITAGDFPATLHISSLKDSTGIDFNVTSSPGTAILSLTATSSSVDSQTGIPTIPVYNDRLDTVTISDGVDDSDTIKVDAVKPTNSANPTIVAGNGNYNSFYSGLITVNSYAPNLTDGETYTDKHIIYLVPVDDLDDYDTDYTKRYIDANTTTTKDINSLATTVVPDGNYYVVIDVNDIAGNYSLSSSVLATKKNVYFDNTDPTISTVSVGTISSNKIYTDENTFDLDVVLSDISGISGTGTMTIILPNSITRSDNSYSSGFSITEDEIIAALTGYTVVSGDIFKVNINANDNVGNNYTYDFNIIYDATAPTKPNKNTTTIEDVDKNVTITWQAGASTDSGSGLKEYRVYKSTSTFTTISNQTLVCTTGTTTYTCQDTTEKDLDESLYYGLVGVDYANNISDANVQSIWTGPECDIDVDDGNEYTKLSTVTIDLTYSNDVNEVAFSCNGTSFSSYQALDDDEEDTKTFTITSGNGCSTTNEEKTIYARVKTDDEDEDDQRTTICSDEIYYDTTAPDVPSGITAATLTNGSISLSWDVSDDENTDSDITYRVYYSLTNNVTSTSSYFETDDDSYVHNPNQDTNVYYKLSALDEAGNQSALSATVTGVSKKIGADLTITIIPSNTISSVLYVGSGLKTIKYVSDESLTGNPQVSIKQGTDSFVSVATSYNNTNKTGQSDFNFNKSGAGIVKIIATNNSNETSTTELNFTIDTNSATFDYNYTVLDEIYTFKVQNYSTDTYRVQYLLNNSDELCLKNKTDTNYDCIFNSTSTPDGSQTISILVYDQALNITQKDFTIIIDNIDEDQILAESLKQELDANIEIIGDNLELFEALGLLEELDSTIKIKFELAKADKLDADQLFLDSNFLSAKDKYLIVKNQLIEIDSNIPKIEIINTTVTETIYDENTTLSQGMILDSNVNIDTVNLYKTQKIKVIRNFDVIKIGTQKFFSVTLKINNSDTSEKTITIIEDIPKSLANNIVNLSFTDIVEVLVKDPVIKYTATIPAGGTKELTYRLMKPVTDVDSITKYNTINKSFVAPVVLSGTVLKEKINIKKPMDKNIFIYLISIIVLFVIVLLIINAITNFKNKSIKIEIKKDTKKEMSDYLGEIKKENTKNEELEETAKEVKQEKQSADKFQENYDYILSAIKKR